MNRTGATPLQQSWRYGACLDAVARVERWAIGGDGAPEQAFALMQVVTRRIAGTLPIGWSLGGPLWVPSAADDTVLWRQLRRHHRWWIGRPLVISPACRLDAAGPRSLERAGWRRIMTGFHSAWLQLDGLDDEGLLQRMSSKWRNALRQSWRHGTVIRELDGAVPWLLEQHKAHRLAVGYTGPSVPFLRRLIRSPGPPPLLLVAGDGAVPEAAMLFIEHGASATYLVGWGNAASRQTRAHHGLLFEAMRRLRDCGIRWLDLGAVDSQRLKGLARFKLGSGAEAVTYPGTFL